MTQTENTPIATLKVEFVNEFEFVPNMERKTRFSDEKVITHPYTSNYEAKVAVKVGNAVKELTFKKNHHYTSSRTLEDGRYVSGQSFDFFGIDENTHPFEELEKAGLHVDYSEAQYQYEKLVAEAKYREVLIKRYNNWKQIRSAKAALANSWIHGFEATIRADKNKRIQAAVLNTTFAVSTKWNEKHVAKITYKGVKVLIHKIDGSFCFNNEKYGYDMNPTDAETGQNVELDEGKLRRAKREGTLFLKAIEAIDYRNERMAMLKKQREETESKNQKVHRILKEVTGLPVLFKEEREYSRQRGINDSWLKAKYFLLIKSDESSYDVAKSLELGYSTYEGGQFTLKGMTLNQDKFKRILDIFLEGREVFTKEEYTKAKAELDAKRKKEEEERQARWDKERKEREAAEKK